MRFSLFKNTKRKIIFYFLPYFKIPIQDTLLETYLGQPTFTKNPKICLYAHYDPDGKIDDFVINHIQNLKEKSFQIILISTSPFLVKEDVEKAKKECVQIILRKNIGIDFCSWKLAISYIPLNSCSKLLLINDSILGPNNKASFDDLFNRIDKAPEDIIGLTDSKEKGKYHLQSYFILFQNKVLTDSVFQKFWNQMICVKNKDYYIDKYEIGLSTYFSNKGFLLRAINPYQKVYEKAKGSDNFLHEKLLKRKFLNTTLFTWNFLYEKKFCYPYIKRELLTRNRFSDPLLQNWEKIGNFNNRHIKNYIVRIKTRL